MSKLASANPAKQVEILLIEDNPADARLIYELLSDFGSDRFVMRHCRNLSDGLGAADHRPTDIVLLDLSLPDSHGMATVQTVRQHHPITPIIVLTHSDDEDLALQALQQGAQDYLVKGELAGHLLVRAIRYAIERRRLTVELAMYAEELHDRNTQMEDDLRVALAVQHSLLPQHAPTFPPGVAEANSRIRFAHIYLPSASVSGDFFDIFPVSENLAGVFISDVMGHGVQAALVTALLKGLIEEIHAEKEDPAVFLTTLNRRLTGILRRAGRTIFATAFYAVIDAQQGMIACASAGHPPALRLRRANGEANVLGQWEGQTGAALGLFTDSQYHRCEASLRAGDLVLLYTDGIAEISRQPQDPFGQNLLLDTLRHSAELPTQKLLETIVADLCHDADTGQLDDDVCLLAVEWLA